MIFACFTLLHQNVHDAKLLCCNTQKKKQKDKSKQKISKHHLQHVHQKTQVYQIINKSYQIKKKTQRQKYRSFFHEKMHVKLGSDLNIFWHTLIRETPSLLEKQRKIHYFGKKIQYLVHLIKISQFNRYLRKKHLPTCQVFQENYKIWCKTIS